MKEAASFAFVDTHCHFDLFPRPLRVLREAEAKRIYSIAVTNTPSVFEPMERLAEGYAHVRPALGLHPELAIERAGELHLFGALLARTQYVGEVGLDYKAAVRPSDRARQRSIFGRILRHCADAGGRVITVHSRRAEADVVAALKEHQPGTFILHWYSGSLKTLGVAVDAGAHFSVNVAMTRSDRGRRIIAEIPRDRLLTESDGPFVMLDRQKATPASVAVAIESIAALWGETPDSTARIVYSNFRTMLKARTT